MHQHFLSLYELYETVHDYIRSCQDCQVAKRNTNYRKAPLHPLPISDVMERLHVDVLRSQNEKNSSCSTPQEEKFHCYHALGIHLGCLENHVLLSYLRSYFQSRHVKYVTAVMSIKYNKTLCELYFTVDPFIHHIISVSSSNAYNII